MAEAEYEHAYPANWVSNLLGFCFNFFASFLNPVRVLLRIPPENTNANKYLKARVWESDG